MLFNIYANSSSSPLPAPGLIVTPEIRIQSEIYLPLKDIRTVFYRLYTESLTYTPIFSSSPFHNAMSWADVFLNFLPEFQLSPNPARILEALLTNAQLLKIFLFASFMPFRFYGKNVRYPEQQAFIKKWISNSNSRTIKCLDAACGTGEQSFYLASLLLEQGFSTDNIRIEGWTVEPLEVWAATHSRFPTDSMRNKLSIEQTSELLELLLQKRLTFSAVDLLESSIKDNSLSEYKGNRYRGFDLILCNGLLGGPIIHIKEQLERTVDNLVMQLAPDGILLIANNFHAGWERKCPQKSLLELFEKYEMNTFVAGEGVGGTFGIVKNLEQQFPLVV